MTTKVRIDLTAGTLEAEGSEDFIRELYQDFREQVGQRTAPPASGGMPKEHPRPSSKAAQGSRRATGERKSTASTRRDRTPVLVKELDLAAKDTQVGLKDFLKRYKKLTSALDLNALFVYYLSREAAVDPITMDHVYTCYKHVGARVPKFLTQSLWDTARRKGTIDSTSLDDVKLTTVGENWVEHDLEKADAE
jgi:hypothetical protein